MPMRLDSATDCAGVAIILYKVAHAGPNIISADQLDSLVLAIMAREGMGDGHACTGVLGVEGRRGLGHKASR